MRRAGLVAGVLGLGATLVVATSSRPPRSPPVRPPPGAGARPVPVTGGVRGDDGAPLPPPRPDRVRRRLVAEVVPEGPVAGWVVDAMARDGDSDPRLLDTLAALGLHPGWLAATAAGVDPWLGAGLVDLERQVGGRCPACGFDGTPAAEALLASTEDPVLGCVLRGLRDEDEGACR